MEKKNNPCRNYLYATYATCSSCNFDGKYTSQDKEVDESVVIREDDGDWREPLVEE